MSQALRGRALNLSTYENKLLALVLVVRKWQTYVLGQEFIVETNQQSLKYLLDQHVGTPAQQKWLTKLLGYDFEIHYKKGKENCVANVLSKKYEGELSIVTSPVATWLA